MYIYNADVYCDACGEAIRETLDNEGKRPENPSDERSYDSDEYPKGPYDDSQEADSPQHCGSHEDCLEATILPSGRKVGYFLQNDLTDDGIEYVVEAIDDGGEVAELWGEYYGGSYSDIGEAMKKADEISSSKSELMDIVNEVKVYNAESPRLVVIENEVYEMSDDGHYSDLGNKRDFWTSLQDSSPCPTITVAMMQKIIEIILDKE